MTDLRVIHLDSSSRYPPLDSNFGSRIQYFIYQNICFDYIQNEITNCRRIDLFLSSADGNIINTYLPLFNDVYFHLYCPTSDSIAVHEALFPQRQRVQVFEEIYLWAYIGYAILHHDFMCLRRINDRNQGLSALQGTLHILLEEVEEAKAGIQPD